MDILYLVGKGSKCDDWELRFSLRSIEKYGKNIDRIFVVGHCPRWLSDDVIKVEIPIRESTGNNDKNKNIYKDLLYAVENTDIGVNHNGEFLISMDDHFYCKDTDFNNYPFYCKDYVNRKCRHMLPLEYEDGFNAKSYQKLLVSTANFLYNRGYSLINFTLHRNMHMNRYFLEEMKPLNDEIFNNDDIFVEGAVTALNYRYTKEPFDYIVCADHKTNNVRKLKELVEDDKTHVFSTDDFLYKSRTFNFLNNLYGDKSKYEK
jgi:hypothetical protein